MRARAPAIAGSLLLCALALCGCATAPAQLPYGGAETSPTPDSDGFSNAFVDAQTPCQSRVITARVRIRGTLRRRTINTALWVSVEAETARLRLDPADTTSPPFHLLASSSYASVQRDEATLVLPAKRWVVRSRSRELVELVLGIPLSGLDLQRVLTGCPAFTGGTLRFERFDPLTVKFAVEDTTLIEVFMRRHNIGSSWTTFAIVTGVPGRSIRWRTDPGKRSGSVLESVRLMSLEWNGTAGRLFDLTFSLDRIQTPATAPDIFTLPIPDGASDFEIAAVGLNVPVPLLADHTW